MAEKRYLFTPGPTPVPPEVLAALAEPVVHHRGPDYRALFGECLERLRAVYRSERDVLVFTSSGTGAMESAVANLCSPGDRVVVVSAGAFGERWQLGLEALLGGQHDIADRLDACVASYASTDRAAASAYVTAMTGSS